MTPDKIIDFARQVVAAEVSAAARMTQVLDDHFVRAVKMVSECRGSVLASGIGKTGIVARKLSATLASTGTPSHYLSAADAVHGDVGAIRQGDLVILISSSGESEEIIRLASLLTKLDHPIIAITSNHSSALADFADVVLAVGKVPEACPLGLAPSASTTAMQVLCDALALTVMKLRNFTAEDFALYHPAGQLGRQLMKVGEAMTFRRGENLAVASDSLTVRQVLMETSSIKRRSGAVILVNQTGKISGLFTDADLRRLLTDNDRAALDKAMTQVMTHNPRRVSADALASHAMAIMRQMRFDELPVVNEADEPVGLIDVQDLVVLRIFDIEPPIT
jgi:arabinose-5-phosphate isomerase